MLVSYRLEDYTAIQSGQHSYVLPETVLNVVKFLNAEFSSAAYQSNTETATSGDKGRNYDNNTFDYKRTSKHPRKTAEPHWEREKLPVFVATKIVKKEGIEKKINDIRICLNKITNKSYDIHRDTIITNINEIVEENGDCDADSDLHKIATTIFDIASTNKFYSEMYALLYKELMGKYPIFEEIIHIFFNTSYMECIRAIRVADQNKDYDAYCIVNKENDKRKAMTVFIANLCKQSILTNASIIDLILTLQDMTIQRVGEPDKLYEVEEITENVFLLVPAVAPLLKTVTGWDAITEKIIRCSQYKVKEHVSLSSRVVFKYKDLVDILRK